MTTKLKKLVIDRVDLVDKGANPDAHIMLYKRDEGNSDMVEKDEIEKGKKSGKAGKMLEKIMGMLGQYKDEVMGELEEPAIEKGEKTVTTQAKDQADIAKAAEVEDIKKQLEDIKKQNEELKKQAEESEKLAKAEREARRDREFIAKAESLKNVSGEVRDIADIMKALDAADPKLAEKLETTLKAMGEQIAKGSLFTEIGKSGAGASTAYGQLESMAKAKLEKGEVKTLAEGIAKAASENPALYTQYQDER